MTSVQAISAALVPYLGTAAGKLAFGLGMAGAALVAAIVVSLAAAWGFAELTGARRSLNCRATQAPLFYGVYVASLALARRLHPGVRFAGPPVGGHRGGQRPAAAGGPRVPPGPGAHKALPAPYRLHKVQSTVTLVVSWWPCWPSTSSSAPTCSACDPDLTARSPPACGSPKAVDL